MKVPLHSRSAFLAEWTTCARSCCLQFAPSLNCEEQVNWFIEDEELFPEPKFMEAPFAAMLAASDSLASLSPGLDRILRDSRYDLLVGWSP